MKRFLLICFLFFLSVQSFAQIYAGGSVGIGYIKHKDAESFITYKVIPEVGYDINNKWSVGLSLGYKKGACSIGEGSYWQNVQSKAFGVQPYVRLNALHFEKIDIFIEGVFTYEKIINEGTSINAGIRPGLLFHANNHIGVFTRLGFCGAEYFKSEDDGRKSGIAGLSLDSSNLSIGACYYF